MNPHKKVLNLQNINPNVIRAQYAVRGAITQRAEQISKELKSQSDSKKSRPFKEVVFLNIGNPQQLKQKPITFFRQVVALSEYPAMLEDSNLPLTKQMFPVDAIERAKGFLESCGGSVGAYSSTGGVYSVRETIAKAIEKRDGFPCAADHVYVTTGASQGVHILFELLVHNSKHGVMIPIPQYPLYCAALSLRGGALVPYYPREEEEWSVSIKDLELAYNEAKSKDIETRALCVINPGNPTGSVLDVDAMIDILRFCKKHSLLLVADEVYQENVYDGTWHSFRKVLLELAQKEPGNCWNDQELISLHTVSKGLTGECGKRAGYMELTNIDEEAHKMVYKRLSIDLCTPVTGQLVLDCMMNPPKEGEPSYQLYKAETEQLRKTLKSRAEELYKAFNQMKNVTCQRPQGALYLYPKIDFPERLIQEAQSRDQKPDELYCLELLEESGICLVAGSGFGEREGYNVRATVLQGGDEFLNLFIKAHNNIMQRYED